MTSMMTRRSVVGMVVMGAWWSASTVIHAFQVPSSRRSSYFASSSSSSSCITFIRLQETKQQQEQEQETTTPLSDMDARVLRAMLQDSDKLDLDTEADLRQLLERGVVKTAPAMKKESLDDDDDQDGGSEFSSKTLKKLTNTKLWQKLSRKAGDVWESAKLYFVNRIERDAMTLAALGLFAWERAVRDVGRALPSAGNYTRTNMKKNPLLLSEQSSAQEQLLQDLKTPMDELQSVGAAVRQILAKGGGSASAGEYYASTSSSTTTAGGPALRTAATARNTRQTFDNAYRRAKQAEAAKKNIPGRFATGMIDTAAELKRELRVEANTPGYKSAPLLEKARDVAQPLLGTATQWFLQRASPAALTGDEDVTTPRLLRDTPVSYPEMTTTTKARNQNYVHDNVMDAVVAPVTRATEPTVVAASTSDGYEQQRQKWEWDQERQTEPKHRQEEREQLRQQQQQARLLQRMEQLQESYRTKQVIPVQRALESMTVVLEAEAERLLAQLQYCITNPENTWLHPNVIIGVSHFNQSLIRQVVTEMIELRNRIKDVLKAQERKRNIMATLVEEEDGALPFQESMTQLQGGLFELFQELTLARDCITELEVRAQEAVAEGAAQALQRELIRGRTALDEEDDNNNKNDSSSYELQQQEDRTPILWQIGILQQELDTLQQTIVTMAENYYREQKQLLEEMSSPTVDAPDERWAHAATRTPMAQHDDYSYTQPATTNWEPSPQVFDPEILEAVLESTAAASAMDDSAFFATRSGSDSSSRVLIGELVSDEDFETAVNVARAVALQDDESDDGQRNENAQDDNAVIRFMLRTLDVLFFLLEKTFTVALPQVYESSKTAKLRLDDVARSGRGSQGWKRIGNAREGSKRY